MLLFSSKQHIVSLLTSKSDRYMTVRGMVMTEQELTQFRTEARNAFYELRRQAADVPELSLDEINAEISASRVEKKDSYKIV